MILLNNYESKSDEKIIINNDDFTEIRHLIIDSRNIMYPATALFFAIKGNLRDGHDFIHDAYNQGVRNFVVSNEGSLLDLKDVNYILSRNVVNSLQHIASVQRRKVIDKAVIAVTGSNGKTVVKEWLSIMFSKHKSIAKTPKSFNSQIGVPLSVWQLNETHDLGIFEAGISTYGEMDNLEKIIFPTIGILTNIGDAHDKGFSSVSEKLNEKIKLFANCKAIIFNGDIDWIYQVMKDNFSNEKLFSWGKKSRNKIVIESDSRFGDRYNLGLTLDGQNHNFNIEFSNEFFFENLMHCISTALLFNLSDSDIEESVGSFETIDMRLRITEGLDGSLIINDAYTNDREALNIALLFMDKHAGRRKKVLVLSEIENANNDEIINQINGKEIDEIFLIGPTWNEINLGANYKVFGSTQIFLNFINEYKLTDKIVLIKGSRSFGFEAIFQKLIRQSHSVTLDIDLSSVEHNLSFFASLLGKETQIVPIIKASAYGTGSEEIAKLLQYKGVYSLGVAFADEAVQLRKSGITIPIIVLNADANGFSTIFNYNLEMEVYSLSHLKSILYWNEGAFIKKGSIHLKLDTGMSRLGFQKEDLDELIKLLVQHPIHISTIFSHLSSSEDINEDDFSHLQAKRFEEAYLQISAAIGYSPKRHLLNTSGIVRFPQYHYELVRLGLGLYGIDSTGLIEDKLEKVHTLSAKIIQIKSLKVGDFIGYNRRHKVVKPMTIAILNIGYADGLLRQSGNSQFHVFIHGKKAPIVGSVCMDLCMIDVSEIDDPKENDEVIIFGKENAIENLAEICNTIPYEILCRIAPRIKRNFIQ
jgi:Alr-MurF fusion protein